MTDVVFLLIPHREMLKIKGWKSDSVEYKRERERGRANVYRR